MQKGKIPNIKHIFFDLDRTLWDFEKNSESVIEQLLVTYDVERQYGITFKSFNKKYKRVNHRLWHLYNHKKITKHELRSTRFTKTFHSFGVKDEKLGLVFEEEYIAKSPYETRLLEGVNEILNYLEPKYTLHIITNGFKEVQHIKLHHSGIKKHFFHVFISEEMGVQKPHKAIFDISRDKVDATPGECLMIGDDYTNDVQGALQAGWKAVYFSLRHKREINPNLWQIRNLVDLKELL